MTRKGWIWTDDHSPFCFKMNTTKHQVDPLVKCSTASIYEASTMTIYEASSIRP